MRRAETRSDPRAVPGRGPAGRRIAQPAPGPDTSAPTAKPRVSVIVPTRDRPAALERCLAALVCQHDVALEIVVVDDASADGDAVAAVLARTGLRGRLVRASGNGPAAARNLGVQSARGDIVCFTDDDCVPDPDWAWRLASACAGADAAAGVTRAHPAAGRSAAAAQLLTEVLQRASLDAARGTLGFAPSCNIACPRELALRLPFDDSFPHAAGEDRDWCARLAHAGVALRFVPQATVAHRPSLGVAGLLRQQRRYGRGAVRFRAAGDGRRLAGRYFYARLAREVAATGVAVAALVALAQVAVLAGAALELYARVSRMREASALATQPCGTSSGSHVSPSPSTRQTAAIVLATSASCGAREVVRGEQRPGATTAHASPGV